MFCGAVSLLPYRVKSVLAVTSITGRGDSVTQNGDRRHRQGEARCGIKLTIAILSRSKELPGLTPRPHTAATQAAGRAISSRQSRQAVNSWPAVSAFGGKSPPQLKLSKPCLPHHTREPANRERRAGLYRWRVRRWTSGPSASGLIQSEDLGAAAPGVAALAIAI